MDRIFHARIPLYMYFFIALVGALALLFLWTMMPLCGLAMLLLLIVAIERVIHTTYTITTDGFLIISHGRFQQKKNFLYKTSRGWRSCVASASDVFVWWSICWSFMVMRSM